MEDAGFGASLNCRGEITILIEPIVTDRARAHLQRLREAQRAEHPVVIILDISRTHDMANTAGLISLAPPDLYSPTEREELSLAIDEVIAQQRYQNVQLECGRELLVDYLPPALKIVLFGAGPESAPLAVLARGVGCVVTVVDERPGYLRRHTFPPGTHCISSSAENLSTNLQLSTASACIIATHNAAYDRRVLRLALASPCPYLGLLGPRKRYLELIAEFRAAGELRAGDVERIYSPVGLDLGADTPEQIALAILSEIHAVFAKRGGGFLRNRNQPLHAVSDRAKIEAANA
jgi:xanthine dehydrogenase accessory factor